MNRFLGNLKTRTGVVSTLAAVVVGITFYKLGHWQLDRADEKTSIVQQHRLATSLPPLEQLPADVAASLYRRVSLTGRFDLERQFLLDNRTVAGQPGFEVLTPLFVNQQKYVLVNRGWIGHNGDRQVTLASDEITTQAVTLTGIVVSPSKGFVLGGANSAAGETASGEPDQRLGAGPGKIKWPIILQFIDYETIAAKLDKIPALDAVVIAADGQAGNYTYNWKPVGSGAEKHLGYAFQWFAMLIALITLYVYLMVFKKND